MAEAAKKEKMVKIRLFKDSNKYKNDLFVGVNGRTFQIKRGVEVEVPESVALVIEDAQAQEIEAMRVMEELAEGSGAE